MTSGTERHDACPTCKKSLTAFAPRPGSLYKCPLCGNLFNVPYHFYGYDSEHKDDQIPVHRRGLKDTVIKRSLKGYHSLSNIGQRLPKLSPRARKRAQARARSKPITMIDEAQP